MEPGTHIGERYVIEVLAGRGGMGSVYRARDRQTGDAVAIKILRQPGGHDERRFLREASVLAELSHPGIVRYVDHGTAPDGQHYLVMEWLEGNDLSTRLRRGSLSVEEAVGVAHRVAEALAVAHRRGVVHRDIKPSNLFLPDDDLMQVKVLDFGVAIDPRASARLTRTGAMIGSIGYMSPEQARGDREVDARADVYALGAVIFRCIAGDEPFTGHEDLAVMIKTIFEEAPRLSSVESSVPSALDDLVAHMLAKAPSARPRHCGDVAEALATLDSAVSVRSTDGRARTPSLTRDERVVRCLAIARAPRGSPRDEATLGEDDLSARDRALARAVERLGATLELLPDGAAVATVKPSGSALDDAACAARCGLAMRVLLPEMKIAVVAQRTESASTGRRSGDLVDRALEMASEKASLRIHVDDTIAGLLGARFDVERTAHGFVLLAARDVDDVSTTLLGRPSECVGRGRELALLEGLLHECIDEPVARVALVTAPAGTGKSRLRYELVHAATRDGRASVFIARADPMRAGSPFATIGSALRQAWDLGENESIEHRRSRIRARIQRLGKPIAEEFITEVLGAPLDDTDNPRLRAARTDPMVMSTQVQRALLDLLAAECASAPVLLVLEDLHCGDVASVTLVETALRELRDAPFMVLALARPEVEEAFPRLFANLDVQHLRLSELTRSASERMVQAALGDRVTPTTTARIVSRAGGNALYLEELIRSVAEGKGDAIPDTLLAIVQGRLEKFDAEPRRVLRAASVFGRTFKRTGVAALLGGERRMERVDSAIALLLEGEVVLRHGDEHAFRHEVVREAAYAMLTDRDSKLGHLLAAEWLAASGTADAAVMAEHFERADRPERAIAQYLRAAEDALSGSALQATIARAERGIQCGARGAVLGALRLVQGEAHLWASNPAGAVACATEALELVPQGTREWYLALAGIFVAAAQLGENARLLTLVAAMSAIEPTADAWRGYAKAAWIVGIALYTVGIYDIGNRLEERLRTMVAASSETELLARGRLDLLSSYRALFAEGDPWGRLRHARSAREHFEEAGDGPSRDFAALDDAHARVCLGVHGAVDDVYALASVVDERSTSFPSLAAKALLADALLYVEEFERCDAAARLAAAALTHAATSPLLAMVRVVRARALIMLGEVGEAEREVRETLDALPASALARADTLTGWAQVMLARGRNADAITAAREAKSILDDLGSVGYSNALIRLVHAQALRANGKQRASIVAITEAQTALLRAADKIDDPELRASFLGAVPQNRTTLALAREWRG